MDGKERGTLYAVAGSELPRFGSQASRTPRRNQQQQPGHHQPSNRSSSTPLMASMMLELSFFAT